MNEIRSKFKYFRPENLAEATDFLLRHGSDARVISGGTDLLIAIRNGTLNSRYVLDVSRLDELRQVSVNDGRLEIGSALTYSEIARHPLIQKYSPALVKAGSQVGSLQIRNTGTLGGNVGNASPAADSVPAMMVHDARVLLKNAESEFSEPLSSFILAPYRTNLNSGSLIKGFSLKIWPEDFRWSYNRIARRRSLAISRAGAAALALLDPGGRVAKLKLSLSSITPQPSIMTVVEDQLIGRVPDARSIAEAAQLVAQEMVRLSGERPSFIYKKPAVVGLTIKTLEEIFFDWQELKRSAD